MRSRHSAKPRSTNVPRGATAAVGDAPRAGSERTPDSAWRRLGFLGAKIAAILVVGALLFTFVYGFHYNRDPGMSPTVKAGDLVVFYRWDKEYKAGNLVRLKFQGETQIRRVVAVAGDTVDIADGGLHVNDGLEIEPDIKEPTEAYAGGIEFPLVVPEGHVFVLGDARDGATDSRIYGPVDVKDTQGKVITILKRRNM